MTHEQLDNLVKTGRLKRSAPAPSEIAGLIRSGNVRLADSKNASLSNESRFDLAYNAAHALAVAALRRNGYRSGHRYLVFQCLPHTLDLPVEHVRVLDAAHRRRNLVEYEGEADISEPLLDALIRAAEAIVLRLG